MSVAERQLTGARLSSARERWSWQRSNRPTLSLTIPTRPLPTAEQTAVASAKSDDADPWKASY